MIKDTIILNGGEVLKIVIQSAVLLLLAQIMPGIKITGFLTAILAVLFFALLNATVGFVLKIMSFPLNFITFGLFNFVINAVILKLTSVFFINFQITFSAALIASVVLAITASIMENKR